MTAPALTREFHVEELPPGQYLKECIETWSTFTLEYKRHLATIIGPDAVLRIELRLLNG
jgi:hypothetical protein